MESPRLADVVNVPVVSPMRFTPLRLARSGSSTAPPLVIWSAEPCPSPFRPWKLVKVGRLSWLPVPSLSNSTGPPLTWGNAGRFTMAPARAWTWVQELPLVVSSLIAASLGSESTLPVPVACNVSVVPTTPV